MPSPSSVPGTPAAEVLGRTLPRIWTPPLVTGSPGPCGCGCALSPETSEGFDRVRFADEVLGRPFDPWQRWVVIHAGEKLPSGRLRFRHVIVIVARQNGKSEIPIVLGLSWLFVDELPCILWTSTQLKYADVALTKAERVARASEVLRDLVPPKKWKRTILGSSLLEHAGCEWWTATANGEGGRSLTVHRLVQDELRQHRDYDAWGAAVPAMSAVPDAQAWHLSNAGEDHSVVLNEQQDAARKAIEEGDTASNVALFEYSAPDSADPEDLEALAQANPGMGFHGPSADELLGEARTAKRAGGEALAKFRTEKMCIRVRSLDAAVDPDAWKAGEAEGDLSEVRSRVACCLDLSPDGRHATLVAAARIDEEHVRVEVVRAWSGPRCADELRQELPQLLARVRPVVLGWLPGGPAAVLAADLKDRKRPGWPPPGVRVEEIRGEVAAVCMGLSEQVLAGRVVHVRDPLLDAHATGAEKLWRPGDVWVFSRRGGGHVDAAYAAAGAVHLARTMPAPVGRPRVLRARRA